DLGPDLAWTDLVGDWQVVSNTAQAEANEHISRADTPLSTADQYVEVDIVPPLSTFVTLSVFVRANGTDTSSLSEGILLVFDCEPGNTYRFFSRTGGTMTQIGSTVSAAPDCSSTVTLRLEVEEAGGGDMTLRGYLDGSLVITETATSLHSAGRYTGIRRTSNYASVLIMDNFEAGDL